MTMHGLKRSKIFLWSILCLLLLLRPHQLISQTHIVVVPFGMHNINEMQAERFRLRLRKVMISCPEYEPVLSIDVEREVFRKIASKTNGVPGLWVDHPKTIELLGNIGTQQIIGGLVSYEQGEYTISIKIRNAASGEVVFHKTYGYHKSFTELIDTGLLLIVERIRYPAGKKDRYFSLGFGGGLLMRENESPTMGIVDLALGGRKWGGLGVGLNIMENRDPAPCSIFYITPRWGIFYLTLGASYLDFQENQMIAADFYNAPAPDNMQNMQAGIAARAGSGMLITMRAFFIRVQVTSNIIQGQWKTSNGLSKSDILYTLEPSLSLGVRFHY